MSRGHELTAYKWFYLDGQRKSAAVASGHNLNLRTPKEIRRRADVQARLKTLEARRHVPEKKEVHSKQAPCGMSLLGRRVGVDTHLDGRLRREDNEDGW